MVVRQESGIASKDHGRLCVMGPLAPLERRADPVAHEHYPGALHRHVGPRPQGDANVGLY